MSLRRGNREAGAEGEAPDYAEPIVGWRVWYVVERGRELVLRSLFFAVEWPPGQALEASCQRRRLLRRLVERRAHEAPGWRCGCGIYAAKLDAARDFKLELLEQYLGRPLLRESDALQQVVGLVSLWGSVLECEHGWRSRCAYPASLFVPVQSLGARRAREIALALERYRVPVETIAAEQPHELRETLVQELVSARR